MSNNDFKRELGREFNREFARIFGLPMPQPDPEADIPELEAVEGLFAGIDSPRSAHD